MLRMTTLWYITTHLSDMSHSQSGVGGTGQPQGGAVRGKLEDFKLKDWNFPFVFAVLFWWPLWAACSLIWCQGETYCLQRHRHDRLYPHFTKIFFLCARAFVRKRAHEQPGLAGAGVWWAAAAAAATFIDSRKTGYTEHRQKTVKLGWNGDREQCTRAAARFYGLGSCSQPPTTSCLFLPAMYCSLHLSHYEAHLLRETRQNNETIDRGPASVKLSWSVTPSCFLFCLISFTSCIRKQTPHCSVWTINVTVFLFSFIHNILILKLAVTALPRTLPVTEKIHTFSPVR